MVSWDEENDDDGKTLTEPVRNRRCFDMLLAWRVVPKMWYKNVFYVYAIISQVKWIKLRLWQGKGERSNFFGSCVNENPFDACLWGGNEKTSYFFLWLRLYLTYYSSFLEEHVMYTMMKPTLHNYCVYYSREKCWEKKKLKGDTWSVIEKENKSWASNMKDYSCKIRICWNCIAFCEIYTTTYSYLC